MEQTNGPTLLRVAGRYAKDTYTRLKAGWNGPTVEEQAAWLREHHPWTTAYIAEELPKIIAELRKGEGRE